MDLVTGVKAVYVVTSHCTREGAPKLVHECRYPLTGKAVVDRVYTDLAVIDIAQRGFAVRDLAPGITLGDVAERTAAPLVDARGGTLTDSAATLGSPSRASHSETTT